jgi:hypothetical protein
VQDRLFQILRQPVAPLIPWVGLALLLLLGLTAVHNFSAEGVRQERDRLENEWIAARHALTRHREARRLRQDLAKVWAMLPAEQDFAPLALGISEEAKKDRVTLATLSSKAEPTAVAHVSKGVLQGSLSGRYEDLRRFIYDLETAEEPLFIEDLELARTPGQPGQNPAFNVKIVAYLRAEAGQAPSRSPSK